MEVGGDRGGVRGEGNEFRDRGGVIANITGGGVSFMVSNIYHLVGICEGERKKSQSSMELVKGDSYQQEAKISLQELYITSPPC